MSLYSDLLAERERRGRPVRAAVIGAGKFGGGLIVQLAQSPGMETAVVADVDPERARQVLAACGQAERGSRRIPPAPWPTPCARAGAP